jgi:hypothetical protein
LKRSIATSTAAVRERASDLSGIVATLVIGAEVEQLDASDGWVKVATEDGRQGWLREEELGPGAEAAPPSLATERIELARELEAVEQTPLETFVTQIEQVTPASQAEAEREPAGWQFSADEAIAAVKKNYTFHALAALFLYTFLWMPGLILNVIWLNAANRDQRDIGKAPEGKGCLVWLLWVFGIMPVVVVVLLIAIGIAVA